MISGGHYTHTLAGTGGDFESSTADDKKPEVGGEHFPTATVPGGKTSPNYPTGISRSGSDEIMDRPELEFDTMKRWAENFNEELAKENRGGEHHDSKVDRVHKLTAVEHFDTYYVACGQVLAHLTWQYSASITASYDGGYNFEEDDYKEKIDFPGESDEGMSDAEKEKVNDITAGTVK